MLPNNADELLTLPHVGKLKDVPPAHTWVAGSSVSCEMDDFMQAVAVFIQVNKNVRVRPTHVYWIMKQLGYRKG